MAYIYLIRIYFILILTLQNIFIFLSQSDFKNYFTHDVTE